MTNLGKIITIDVGGTNLGKIITIDVGGTIFKTYYSTIVQADFFRHCLESNESNNIFVDRDPADFNGVLRFLRGMDKYIDYHYRSELDYYGMPYQRRNILNWIPYVGHTITVDDFKYIANNKITDILNVKLILAQSYRSQYASAVMPSTFSISGDKQIFTLTITRNYYTGDNGQLYDFIGYMDYEQGRIYQGLLLDVCDEIKKLVSKGSS
jgi:hypothetical protein